MRPIRLLSVLLCAAAFCCGTAAGTEPDRIRIACYNVESLFDTVPDPSAGDAEFTPHSPRRWNTERYRMKINHISRVIDDLDADLLALAEVENEAVVRDLMYAMRSDYNYIHRNSGDPRGMDVVLLYRGSRFFPTRVRQVFGRGLTRSLLTVDGELLGESVTLILCHLPSQMNAARYRAEAFRSLRRTVDSLLTGSPQRKLVVLGDFNAEPDARESRKILHVRPETALRNAPVRALHAVRRPAPARLRHAGLPRPPAVVRLHSGQRGFRFRKRPALRRPLRHFRPGLPDPPVGPMERLSDPDFPSRPVHRRIQRPSAGISGL